MRARVRGAPVAGPPALKPCDWGGFVHGFAYAAPDGVRLTLPWRRVFEAVARISARLLLLFVVLFKVESLVCGWTFKAADRVELGCSSQRPKPQPEESRWKRRRVEEKAASGGA